MLIIWGKSIRRRRKGSATHFCPACRCLCAFRFAEVSRVSHVYWIPLGRGERIADELTCEQCGVLLGFQPGAVRARFTDDDELQDLGPTALNPEALAERTDLEGRAATNELSSDERLRLIAEPFVTLQYMHEERAASGGQTSITAVLQLLLLVGIVACFFLWYGYTGSTPGSPQLLAWCVGITAATIGFGVLAVYRGLTHTRRAAGAYVHKHLVASLRPLSPTVAELEAVLADLREREFGLALTVEAPGLAATLTPPDHRYRSAATPPARAV